MCPSFFSTRLHLLRLLPRAVSPALPAKLQVIPTIQAKHNHACYLYFNHIDAAQDRRGKTARRAWPEQRPCYRRRVYMLVHGLCRRQHFTTTSPCMVNAKRRPKTTIKQLNRRCLAVPSAGVINRELSEAPGTRRPRSLSHVGRASRPPRAHTWDYCVLVV